MGRQSFELRNEVQSLRQQLDAASNATGPARENSMESPVMVSQNAESPSLMPSANHTLAAKDNPVLCRGSSSTAVTGPSPDPLEHTRAPGLTTKPGVDDAPENTESSFLPAVPRSRAIGNVSLTIEEIEELHMMYDS